jgi:hypothetical protein
MNRSSNERRDAFLAHQGRGIAMKVLLAIDSSEFSEPVISEIKICPPRSSPTGD